MGISRRRTPGRSLGVLTQALVLALAIGLLLAGSALAAGAPARPTAKAPKGSVTEVKPTFTWSTAKGAAKYELRVYKGSKLQLKKTGLTKRSWKSTRALPPNVALTWKVRASNARGSGAWSKSLRFTVVPPSSAKAITAFSFATPAASGVVNETLHTIALTVPYGTDVRALVPTVTMTGASVSPVSGVAHDFTSPVTYTVTAADASSQEYVVSVTVAAPLIGQSYGGGKVAYIFQDGDPGYVAGETRGLIAAESDQSTGIRWYNGASDATGATGTALGTGSANTTTIITAQGSVATSYAAGLARAYDGGGFGDWYLPSMDELSKLYASQDLIGNFATANYWSSSEDVPNPNLAWTFHFGVNSWGTNSKSVIARVRAVRSFPADPAKAITAFSFASPAASGVIDETLHTIALTVPYGTNVSALAATFTTTGAVVAVGATPQVSGTTQNDFSSAVTYTVTAADASSQAYFVTVTVAAKPLAIGDAYQGGKVAYILQPGDADYVAGQTRGLIAATADQSTGIMWAIPAYQSTAVPGGTSTPIGAGSANTSAIVSQNGAGSTYAAGLARAYTDGVYHDWYLPSANELDKLCLNQAVIGGFGSAVYWSSSESLYNVANAWFQNFGVGFQSSCGKNTAEGVRAVRTFAPAGVATQIAVKAGDAQSATVSTAVAMAPSVIIRDSANDPVADVSVTFAVASGGGSVTGATTTTNASGIATVGSWTLGATVGANTLTATSPGLTGSPVTFSATGIVAIGDAYQGGIVAYILQPTDPGYVDGETRGLIAATADQGIGSQWYYGPYITMYPETGAIAAGLGSGSANTTTIITVHGGPVANYAAGLARAYTDGVYHDWYLPSKDELNKLYLNRAAIGGFASTQYWSSSEVADDWNKAWSQDFGSADQYGMNKYPWAFVRAVRAFPADPAKAITAFGFTSPAATGTVNEAAHTIAVTVPFGTDVSTLVATFTTTGAAVAAGATPQVSGTTPNDFGSPVTYTVTAADVSTQDYAVTVTVAAP